MKSPIVKICYIVLVALFSLPLLAQDNVAEIILTKSESNDEQVELFVILNAFVESFKDKIDSNYTEKVNISLIDGSEGYTVSVGKNKMIVITPGTDESANISFSATLETYNKFYHGEMTATTAMGQERAGDPIPLNYSFGKHLEWNDETLNKFYFFAQRFFNTHPHDKILLGQEHARIVHGAYGIPIFYRRDSGLGVRSAWYQLNKGQKAGRPGDVNPFPQYVIVISGECMGTIGEDTFKLKPGEAYYIAPFLDHIFWNDNDEPVQVVWLAWEKTGGK